VLIVEVIILTFWFVFANPEDNRDVRAYYAGGHENTISVLPRLSAVRKRVATGTVGSTICQEAGQRSHEAMNSFVRAQGFAKEQGRTEYVGKGWTCRWR
jgi:hypothetical protein